MIEFPLEQFVAGGILRQLLREFGVTHGRAAFPVEPPPEEALSRAMEIGAEAGLHELARYYEEDVKQLGQLMERHLVPMEEPDHSIAAAK